MSLGVVAVIIWYHRSSGRNTLLSVALGLLLGGALGNMIDRFRIGYVVDCVDAASATCGSTRSTSPIRRSACAILLLIVSAFVADRPRTGAPSTATTADTATPPSPPMPDAPVVAGVRTVRVPNGPAGRIDRFVADATGLSRSHVQKLISDGRLTVDGEPVRANAIVAEGSEVRLDVPEPVALDLAPAPDIPLRIVYEDDDLLIVDKPAGLVVHPSPGHHDGDTLVNALLARAGGAEYGGIAGVARPGIVHRLDRDTSGLLMVAKHDGAQTSLMAQLKARRVRKTYQALVAGSVAAAVGRIEAPVGRDPKHRTRMAVVPDGRASVTGYRVRERFTGWTLLELDLVTGRTHQIRVHLDAIGHPVAGDPVYGTGTSRRGPDGLDRLFLHAWRLELASPSDGRLIRATAPLAPELEAVLDGLRAAETAR